jgi:signal recognition particle receptor subunit beta
VSSVNLLAREVAAKIVFYGPGLSGKTTTLKKIHDSVRPPHRGEMMSLATEGDRTLFFDFMPVKVERVGDCAVRLALYTVPGQVFYNATRKLVLQGADGVVFVADSNPEALDSNVESLKNLEENLLEQGIRLERFPLVFQWNKRDLPKAISVEELRHTLNHRAAPEFETSATSGRGVVDTLKSITRLVIKDLRAKKVVPPPRASASAYALENSSTGLSDQISEQLSRQPLPPPPEPETRKPSMAPPSPAPSPMARPSISKAVGLCAALAPSELSDYAKAVDAAYASGDAGSCVRACQEAVHRALAFAGEGSESEQAFLLDVHGADLLRLRQLSTKSPLRVDDAAFAVFVVLQVLTRISQAGLSPGI